MSAEHEPQAKLTPDHIKELTTFALAMTFTEFCRRDNWFVSPSLHDERERLSAQFGEDNVMPSFYLDEQGDLQLGLFVRHSDDS